MIEENIIFNFIGRLDRQRMFGGKSYDSASHRKR